MVDGPVLDPTQLTPALNVCLVKDDCTLGRLESFLQKTDLFGFDTETNVKDFFYHRRLRVIQIGNREEQYVIDLWELVGRDASILMNEQGSYGAKLQHPQLKKLVNVLRPHLETNRTLKVGTNLQFDYTMVKWCLGLRPWNLYDVYLAEKVYYAGEVNFWADNFWKLTHIFQRYFGASVDKGEQLQFLPDPENIQPLTEEQLMYAALDTRLPIAIRAKQLPKFEKEGLTWAVQIENDAIPAFSDIHINGLLVDRAKWQGILDKETKPKHKANIEKLDTFFIPLVGKKPEVVGDGSHLLPIAEAWKNTPSKTKEEKELRAAARVYYQEACRTYKKVVKEYDTWEGQAQINYGSNPKLLKALRKAGFGPKKLPNTDDQCLKVLAGEPIIDALRDYRKTQKILSTYGEEWLRQHIRLETGRVHSNLNQLGADTGRSSSDSPNVQNILNGDWRSCFISAPGWKFITIDYNGCELRILADLSGEPVWLDAFNKGWDVHSVGAEIIFGDAWKAVTVKEPYGIVKDGKDKIIPICAYYYGDHQKCECPGHKKLRGRIKAINFGLAYGMEAKKLAEDLGMTIEEAQDLLDIYRGKFVVVTLYLNKCGQEATVNFESRTMSGRRRKYHKPSWEVARERALADKTARLKKLGQDVSNVTLDSWEINRKFQGMMSHIQREGKNTPIQGTNADWAKLAMGCGFDPDGKPYAWHVIEPKHNALLVNFVHDELCVEAPEQCAAQCMADVIDCMERAGREFVKKIPVVAEGHIEKCWTKE
jgi:DNA polymerase I-like protein with 3'-5' exonuclease and polymerase domains